MRIKWLDLFIGILLILQLSVRKKNAEQIKITFYTKELIFISKVLEETRWISLLCEADCLQTTFKPTTYVWGTTVLKQNNKYLKSRI